MFTGIVQERGRVRLGELDERGNRAVAVELSRPLLERLDIGASLAVNGVCLTATTLEPTSADRGTVTVDLSPETLRRTTLGNLEDGDLVNLEPALRAGDALGGHWVQGHVDTTVELVERRDLEHGWGGPGEHRELAFGLPPDFARYVVEKGSVTLDGVSLTVSRLLEDRFEVALIPHTLEVTTLGERRAGDRLNFEVDVLAKYVERAVTPHLAARFEPPIPES